MQHYEPKAAAPASRSAASLSLKDEIAKAGARVLMERKDESRFAIRDAIMIASIVCKNRAAANTAAMHSSHEYDKDSLDKIKTIIPKLKNDAGFKQFLATLTQESLADLERKFAGKDKKDNWSVLPPIETKVENATPKMSFNEKLIAEFSNSINPSSSEDDLCAAISETFHTFLIDRDDLPSDLAGDEFESFI